MHCVLSKMADKEKKGDPTAVAMRQLVKEQKAQRKHRKGMCASSSEDEDGKVPFNCTDSLKKYGLDRINSVHMMKNQDLKTFAKVAAAKVKDGEQFVVGDDVLKFTPQWLGSSNPKSLEKGNMTHAIWVASWWSRALTQITAQGHAELQVISFQDMLTETPRERLRELSGSCQDALWELSGKSSRERL